MMQQSRNERSLGELFSDLTRDMGTLVRQEVDLARTEMTRQASKAGKDVASMAVGGAVAYAGFLAIVAAIILALGALGLPLWVSALIVGIVIAGIGYVLIQRGREALKKVNVAPRQTVETLKEDAEWAKEQTR
jgi:TRAP-type C4-dicarboxylate transport system permease small subunit